MDKNDFKIFSKKPNTNKNIDKDIIILSKNDIISSIPIDAKSEEDLDLALTKLEIRLRIFKFPNTENEIVEISQKKYGDERLFLNHENKWISYNIDNVYDKYLIKKYYYYQ